MKVSFIPLALTCTGLVASATPLRVIVVSNGANVPDNGPVAHMMAPQRPPQMPQPVIISGAKGADGVSFHAPCGGARFRQKVTSLADSFKIALGFKIAPPQPMIYKSLNQNRPHYPLPPNAQKLAPLPWVGAPPRFEGKTGPKEDRIYWGHKAEHDAEHPHHRHQGHGRFRFRHHERGSFLMRVHFALMSLGVWEGRAVAFVLGCGIGVLLRMFWVISVLTFRAIRGPSPSSSSHEYTVLSFEDADAEEIFVAPPTYTYPIEKTTEAQSAPVPVVVITAAPAEEEEEKQQQL